MSQHVGQRVTITSKLLGGAQCETINPVFGGTLHTI